MDYEHATQACQYLRTRLPVFPTVGLILGSGLKQLGNQLDNATAIDYADIPHFPKPTVEGHGHQLVVGQVQGVWVACLTGRKHAYEGMDLCNIRILIHTLKMLGCSRLILTNAAGSLNPHWAVGQVALIADHINFLGLNPLAMPNDERLGPRFFPMENAYEPVYRQQMQQIAKELDIELPEGIYLATLGPNFETPAEIRAFKALGADLVGMSTVPEVLVARHVGLSVLGLSAITNLAAGLSEEVLSHEGTLSAAALTSERLTALVLTWIARHGG